MSRSMSNNQAIGGVFFQSEDQDSDTLMGLINPLNIWHSPPFPSIYLEEGHHEIGGCPNMLDDHSSFEAPSSLPLQQLNTTSEISCLEKIVLHGLEKGQCSGTKRNQDSDSLDMQREEIDEDGPKQNRKQQKRKYSADEHNQNNRLGRQRFKAQLKTLQELIPKCTKSNKGSILDEAIKYIKLLQYQLQEQQMMMSRGVACDFPMSLHSPWVMPAGMHIPQFPQNYARGVPRMGYGMGMGIMGMGMGYSMANMEFPSPSSVATGGLALPLPYYMSGNILPNPWTPTISVAGSRPLVVTTQGQMNTMSHNAYHGHTHN